MKHSWSIHERFLNDVHRRMIVIRIIERTAVALSFAWLAVILTIAAAFWQRTPTAPILIWFSAFGLIVGSVLAMRHLPTLKDAAAESDRQLRLDDLLASALSHADSGDEFASAVRSMADARCSSLAPSEVIFRRLGIRSWSAIAVTMCIAVTLAVIPFGPVESRAVDADSSVLSADANQNASSNSAASASGASEIGNDPSSDDGTHIPTLIGDSRPASSTSDPAKAANSRGNGGSSSGGTGRSSTAVGSQSVPRSGTSNSSHSNQRGAAGGGGNAAVASVQNHETANGAAGAASKSNDESGPLSDGSTVGGPAAPIDASNAPREHRDLVRDFLPPDEGDGDISAVRNRTGPENRLAFYWHKF